MEDFSYLGPKVSEQKSKTSREPRQWSRMARSDIKEARERSGKCRLFPTKEAAIAVFSCLEDHKSMLLMFLLP